MAYTKQVWTNDSGLAISAASLGHIEEGIETAQETAEASASTGATNLTTSRTATTVNVNSDTGTDAMLAAADAANAGVMTAAMQSKLAAIANNATSNSSDAVLMSRANHTGTQDVSTIAGIAEVVRDTIAAALVAGANVTITPDDVGDTITITATGGEGGVGTTNLTFSRTGTTVTVAVGHRHRCCPPGGGRRKRGRDVDGGQEQAAGIASNATSNETNSFLLDRTNHTGAQAISSDQPADLVERQGERGGLTIWKGTQAQYNALGTYDNNTIYFVKG